MTWFFEWLVWRRDLRQLRKVCESRGHDITGPHLALGGWQVYTCTRCVYRFPASMLLRNEHLQEIAQEIAGDGHA